MGTTARTIACCALLLTGCSSQISGLAVLPPTERPGVPGAIDVDALLLDISQMRALTGAGDDLAIIPSMDGKSPVDIELLARQVPPSCRFLFIESEIFRSEVTDFHKTTYQNPPEAALISQAAAAYPDAQTARAAFDALVDAAGACAYTSAGAALVGQVSSGNESMTIRPSSTCGRDYALKSVVLAEVTFCRYPASVPELVMTNLLRGVPG
ncbi:sensor domain-containing protein [soil metagenome]